MSRRKERYVIYVTFRDGTVECYTYPNLAWMQKRATFFRKQGCAVLTVVAA